MLEEYMSAPETPVTDVAKADVPATDLPATDETMFTDEQFAHLGGGTLAYVKMMSSEEVQRVFPQAPHIDPGLHLFALLGADGMAILLSDSRETAMANAFASELQLVSLQ